MDVILIAAITADGIIARHSLEPVCWSQDLKLFKKQTKGYPVIMGSNTYKTLVVDLKGRQTIVVYRNDDPQEILADIDSERCFIIGGSKIFSRFAPYLTQLYLTYHPLIFESGLKLFNALDNNILLILGKKIPIPGSKNMYQFQYKITKQ